MTMLSGPVGMSGDGGSDGERVGLDDDASWPFATFLERAIVDVAVVLWPVATKKWKVVNEPCTRPRRVVGTATWLQPLAPVLAISVLVAATVELDYFECP